MNRRDFTRGLATFGLAPVVPIPSLGASTATVATVSATAEHMYFMGWYTARMNKACSPDILIRELNLNADVANDIFARLVKNQTVSAPNALGISRTIDPLAENYKRVAENYTKQIVSEQPAQVAQKRVVEPDKITFEEDALDVDQGEGEDDQSNDFENFEDDLTVGDLPG